MRAYTSLAGHVLGSHPQINGYYEMHLGYEEPAALDRQLQAFLQDELLKPGSRYLFDKLLHNDYVLKPERPGLSEIKILVALVGRSTRSGASCICFGRSPIRTCMPRQSRRRSTTSSGCGRSPILQDDRMALRLLRCGTAPMCAGESAGEADGLAGTGIAVERALRGCSARLGGRAGGIRRSGCGAGKSTGRAAIIRMW